MKFYLAPLEGITSLYYRKYHSKYFKGVDKYFIPFLNPAQCNLSTRDERELKKENKFTDYVPKELKEENNENKITENEQSNTKNTINENSDNNTNDNTNNNKTDNNINNNVINTNDSNEEKNEEKDINKDKEEEKTELNITNTKDIKKFEEEDDPALNEILSKQALKYKYKNSNPILLSLYEKDINDYLEEDSLKGLVGLKNFGNTCFKDCIKTYQG